MKKFSSSQPRVLVVDDDRAVLDEAAAALSAERFACHCCCTPQEALAAAQAEPPDLILCDVNLHGESGRELIERMRQEPELAETPVMFLSGSQLPDVIRRSHLAGGSYCIRKPFDSAVLVELIDQALAVPEG